MAAFFSQIGYKATAEWKEEIVFFDPEKGTKGSVLPDGTTVRLAAADDPREAFATAARAHHVARAVLVRTEERAAALDALCQLVESGFGEEPSSA